MRTIWAYFLWACLPAVAASAGEFAPIFNGRNLDGWDGDAAYWSVEDGAIVGRTTAAHRLEKPTCNYLVYTGGEVADFELRLKFRIESGNSGVQYRSRRLADGQVAGYQADMNAKRPETTGVLHEQAGRQIIARHGERVVIDEDGKRQIVGSLGDADDLIRAFQPKQWNQYLIIAQGPTIKQSINGRTILEITDRQRGKCAARGIIALQLHWGPAMTVRFKEIELKRMASGDATSAGDTTSSRKE